MVGFCERGNEPSRLGLPVAVVPTEANFLTL
jgi:hypothetical protein